ncbi:NAD-dependent epimerase/dehydratase [Methylocella silvestris BL2]|uniref:NAD-dependent epimerase/dehydratase n=1 Tax=Methylocella silvestris (strain DSM 15510 / CIP 108128 / LMG 27833 / NCIMB 13906 / BL2) TaxID=395965 RepID=B8ENK6_METSB|nr:NAD-dependent epimerase/dehydratase family protein [Methylocella silvestris]ACK50137.1 NAD-dependent epimerase/dehydratase [Methylocella silvestris BL2]
MRILVTGSAGFIGFHMAARLLADGHEVVGVDGFTHYYDPELKRRRNAILSQNPYFTSHAILLEDASALKRVYDAGFDAVYHFAAQAGVRYSLENPRAYVDANLTGAFNLLELMREAPPKHALMASTSSVYGANTKIPFHETDRADHPLTFYAATKKANEEMAHSYAHLFKIPVTMLRFFTVYGPWGRPDMALFKFVDAMVEGRPIDVFNHGKMKRDFTFVGDLVEAMALLIDKAPPAPDSRTSPTPDYDSLSPVAPWRIVNIGTERPVGLMDFIEAIETATGLKAERNYLEMQKGDVPLTFASTRLLFELTGYRPATTLAEGVKAFVDWRRSYLTQQ